MFQETNRFGTGMLATESDLTTHGRTYALCCACMSIWSEFLSWANAYPEAMAGMDEAKNIVVLGCQVTDLAVYNDMRYLETLQRVLSHKPDVEFYVGGCLARRFDIQLPEGVKRLSNVKQNYQSIRNRGLIDYAPPFWVPGYQKEATRLTDGHLFRDMYPLRIGSGCSNHCTYCTIRDTRGKPEELDIHKLDWEFRSNDSVVVIADSISKKQLHMLAAMAIAADKPISIRNLEPGVACDCMEELFELTNRGLLDILHVPVQSTSVVTLQDMHRDPQACNKYVSIAGALHACGVTTATNVIVDYKGLPDPEFELLASVFDYISWNPFWDGVYDADIARARFDHYITDPSMRSPLEETNDQSAQANPSGD